MTIDTDSSRKVAPRMNLYLGAAIAFILLTLLEKPYNNIVFSWFEFESEYTFSEQLVKALLLGIMQLAFFGYIFGKKYNKIGISITFLIFALCLYLSESNMITEDTQPFFGLILIVMIGHFSIRLRAWSCIVFLALAVTLIAGSSLLDKISDLPKQEIDQLGQVVSPLFKVGAQEEKVEILGVGMLFLSAITLFIDDLYIFLKGVDKRQYLLLVGTLCLAVGNGFLHYQYMPSNTTYMTGLTLSIFGVLALLPCYRNVNVGWGEQDVSFKIICCFTTAFFVILPGTFGQARNIQSLLIWVPTFVMIGWCLRASHSITTETRHL